jgi:hypothetical protein
MNIPVQRSVILSVFNQVCANCPDPGERCCRNDLGSLSRSFIQSPQNAAQSRWVWCARVGDNW